MQDIGDDALKLQDLFESLSPEVRKYGNEVGISCMKANEFKESQNALAIGFGNMNIKARLAAAGVGILNAVLNVGIGLLVGMIINGIIKLADAWIHRNERLIESANELSASYKQALDDISSSLSRVNSLKEEFAELSKGVDNFGNNVSLDTRSYERYLSIVQELVEINPSLIEGYDAEGNAIINKNGAIEETIRLLKEERKQQAYNAVNGKNEKGKSNFSIAYEGEKAKYLQEKNSLEGNRIDLASSIFNGINLNDKELVSQIRSVIGNAIGNTDFSTTLSLYLDEHATAISENYLDILDQLSDAGLLTREQLNALSNEYQLYAAATQKAASVSKEFLHELNMAAIAAESYDILTTTGQNALTSILNNFTRDDLLNEMDEKDIVPFVTRLTSAIAEATPEVQDAFATLLDTESLKKSLSAKDFVSAIEDSTNAVKSYFEQKELDIDVVGSFHLNDTSVTDIQAMLDRVRERLTISAKFKGDTEAIDEFMEKIGELPVSDLMVVVNSMINEVGQLSIDEFLAKLNQLKTAAAEQQILSKLSDSAADLEKQLQSLADAEADYAKITDTVNGKHQLTDKEVVELCSKYAGLQDSLYMTSEGWKLESGAMDVVNNSLTALQNSYITAQQSMNEMLNSGVGERLRALGIELEGIQGIADAYQQLSGYYSSKTFNPSDYSGKPFEGVSAAIKHVDLSTMSQVTKYGRLAETIATAKERIKELSGKVGSGSVGGGSGGGSAVEKYTAEIDKLYNLTVKLTEAQEDLTDIQRKMSDLDDTDYTGRIAYIEQEIQKTQEINDLLHQQNELRDRIINQNVAELRGKGFQVDYNDSINYLEIQNMEHLNELKGANQQATNELVQETEALISATIELNDANKDNSASWQDNASALKGYTKEIVKLREEMFDSFLSKWDKFFSVHKDFNLFGPAEEIKRKKELLKEIVEWYEKGIISEEKYTEAYNDTAKDIYNIQLDSLEEILDMVEKMLRQESEDMVDALEGQKDRYRDIIDLKKQSLRLTDQELSYNREIDDKVREIAKLQARIDQLSLDDSREAGAERAALLDELAKLQAELAEFQNDHSLELQEDALDKEYDNFEQNIDKEIDAVEAGMNDAAGMHQRVIEYINEHWDTLYSELIEWNSIYGTGIENDVKGAWDSALTSLEAYLDAYRQGVKDFSPEQAALTETPPRIPGKPDYATTSAEDIVAKMYANSQSAASRYNQIKTGNANFDAKLWSQDSVLQQLSQSSASLGEQLAQLLGKSVRRGSNGVWYIDGEDLFRKYGYHVGGIVGKKAGDFKDNEMFTLLEKGEAVLTGQQQQRVVDLIKSGGIQPQGYNEFLRKADTIIRGQELLAKMKNQAQQPNITIQIDNHIEGSGIMNDEKLLRKINDHTCNGLVKAFRKAGIMNGSLPIRPS